MSNRVWFFSGLLLLVGCIQQPVDRIVNHSVDEGILSLKYDRTIDSIISLLSLEEKVNLLHANGKFWSGGISRLGIPDLQYTDGPLGIREEIERDSWEPLGWTTDSATFFPAGTALGATWNPSLARMYGEAIGAEARARNKDVLLVPAINIIRSPLNGRNYEYMTEDPYLNAKMVVPYVQGVQSCDVAACVKHFAINNQETNRGSIDVIASERAIREIYLPGFRAAVVEGGAYSVMGAYNKFRGEYLCENEYLLNQVLKKEWGFNGVVVSDWGAVHHTVNSAKAGLDIEMGTEKVPYHRFYFADPLIEAVKKGEIGETLIDEKVKRILRLVFNCRITRPDRKKGSINTSKHSEVVYQVAAESVVLLKNDSGFLPIDTLNVKRIAVIGDNATRKFGSGGFGAGVKARYEVTPLQGLKNRVGNRIVIDYAQGYAEKYLAGKNDDKTYGRMIDYTPDPKLIEEAVSIARRADVAIVFAGSNRHTESESIDRDDMRLPFAQEALISAVVDANPHTIVVMTVGTAYDLNLVHQKVSSILLNWFNGSEAGHALADILLGKQNPSGKLPFTIPARLMDSPAHAMFAFPGDSIKVEYLEDILVGYRWFDTKNIEPLYCFGHGLSYSHFEYMRVTTDKTNYSEEECIQLAVSIANQGGRSGAEVIQVYTATSGSRVFQPQKQLKAMAKVELNANTDSVVHLSIPVTDLAFYDEKSNRFMVEPGQYRIMVGSSSRDIRLNVSVDIK